MSPKLDKKKRKKNVVEEEVPDATARCTSKRWEEAKITTKDVNKLFL